VKVSRSRFEQSADGGVRGTNLGHVASATGFQLAQQFGVVVIQPGGNHHLDVDVQVTARAGAQVRHPAAPQRDDGARLRPCRDRDLAQPVQDRVHRDRGTQRRVHHRHRHRAVQVVAVAHEDVMGLLMNFDVQVTRRPSAGPDLALGGQPNPHPLAHPGRDLDADLPTGPHPAVAHALVARVGDDDPDATTGGTRARCQHLTQQRTLHGLDLAATTAGVARHRRGIAVGALALAAVAQHRGVDGDLFGDAGCALFKIEPYPQQRVRSRPNPADRAAGSRGAAEAAAEECLEHVAQISEAAETAARRTGVF